MSDHPPALRPPARKIGFPIPVQIVVWFLLNLLFLALAGFFLVRWQFHIDSLLSGRVGDRIQSMAEVIVGELDSNRNQDIVLARSAGAYHVRIGLFAPTGERIAGTITDVPPKLAKRLAEPVPAIPPPPVPPFPPPGGGAPPPPPRGAMPPFPKTVIHTDTPQSYWIIVRVMLRDKSSARPLPATLVIATDSLQAGGGLLFDFTPWIAAGGGALLLSVLFWIPLLRHLTRPIQKMTVAAEEIALGRFEVQLDTDRRDELGRLATALTRMAARLEEAFTGQKRFLGDTAHELCSPLARMEMALGVLEQRADGCEDALLADVHEEVRAMSALVDDLLVFSKASAGTRAATLQPVLLAQLAAGVISREAGATGSVTSDIPESLAVTADPALLARALANVIRNAVRYAGDAGPIRLSAVERSHEALLSITDCGPGVPGEMLHRLFDPFFRPESARTRETGGTGLGLAIVKSCIEACHGSVAVKNLKPRGFCVEIRLTKEPSSDS